MKPADNLFDKYRSGPGDISTLSPVREGAGDARKRRVVYMERMKRRTLLLAPLALVALTLPVSAQPISLGELSRYFNDFTTAESPFTQINPDGTIATGRVLIHRPGRMRFEYDPPDNSLVIAGGGQVGIFDPKSNQGPSQYPLSRTPLNLILAQNVNLGQDRMVVAHREDGNTTVVVAQDPEHPEYGNIRLVFTANPTELRQWRVTDDSGRETTVILGDLRTGVQFPPIAFNIAEEAQNRQNR